MRRCVWLICVLALSFAAPVVAQQRDTALLARNQAYDRAILTADSAALADLYAADFVYVGPDAVVRGRDAQIRSLVRGVVDVLEGESSDVRVRLYGETAILTGSFRGRARTPAGEVSFHERYSSVWVRQAGTWRLVHEHASMVPGR